MVKKCNKKCERLRLVDRCVDCNPGYLDANQAHWIYQEQRRTGASLRKVELAWIRNFK